tara:strand:- start:282 stop:461 length:180 start_codon:yes stop_codon:yes gene_type:complete
LLTLLSSHTPTTPWFEPHVKKDFKPYFGRKRYHAWLQDRVHAELLAYVLAAMGVFNWRK